MTDAASTLTIRTPEDVLAVVPVVLGFTPERSLVLVCLPTRGRPFHARVDLPPTQSDVATVLRLLLEPVKRHAVDRVAFVLYGPDSPLTRSLGRRLVRQFTANGVDVVDVLRAEAGEWSAWEGRRWGASAPFDATAHRFRAEAVLQGIVVHESRDGLSASLEPLPAEVAAVADALTQCEPVPHQRYVEEAVWVLTTVLGQLRAREPLTAADTARLLCAVRIDPMDTTAWMSITRETALDHVALWTSVVRRAPGGYVATPAAVLALAAWLSGNGALAWCALDRCTAEEPEHDLGRLMTLMLTNAVNPDLWELLWEQPGDADWEDDWDDDWPDQP
jgi:hypothetical protein